MSKAIDSFEKALERAAAIRPKVGGFPYLAESLRLAGVTRNAARTVTYVGCSCETSDAQSA
jgi:hypothetical protein